jgi:diguanylate cyclase (GGDEF)-like protein/PAS domain S-box-containing protein
LNIYALPVFVVGALTAALGLAVLVRERASRISWAFAGLTSSAAIWLLGIAANYIAPSEADARAWVTLEHIGVVLIPSTILIFSLAIVRRLSQFRFLAVAALVSSALFYVSVIATDQFVTGVHRYDWGYYPLYGPLTLPFLVFFSLCLIASLRLFWLGYHRAVSVTQRQRLKFFFVAFSIAYVGSVDYLATYRIPLYPFGYVPVFIFLVLSAWSIRRYHFFDITPAFAANHILAEIPDPLLVLDRNGIVRVLNPAACRLLARAAPELIGRHIQDAISQVFTSAQVEELLRRVEFRDLETNFGPEQRDGRVLSISSSVMRNKSGQITAIVCLARDISERKRAEREVQALNADLEQRIRERTAQLEAANLELQKEITERKRAEAELQHLAFHDVLTGLPNRALFMQHLEQALHRAHRHGTAVALMFFDLDNFKIINDSLGHLIGDRLLVAVTERVRTCVREQDTVARFGGDEFTIVLEDCNSPSDAIHVAERIASQLEASFTFDGHDVFTSASLGITLSAEPHAQADDLLREADVAMYRAKEKGKARYELFDTSMHDRAMRRGQMETELRHAIERREFRIEYQPIVHLETGEILEVEALIRWLHPERGLLAPMDFIPLAEETGLILPLQQWMLEQACCQVRTWQLAEPGRRPLLLNVNLSATQFRDSKMLDQLAQVLRQSGLAANCLRLEITETVMMQPHEVAVDLLQSIKSLGIQLAMDDFGTGFSSLSYLQRLPLDVIKIDRSFIHRLDKEPRTTAIVRTIVQLAKILNLTVTAEGIETAAQLACLRELGCDQGQGYFFAPPLTSEAFSARLMQA